MPRLLRGLFRVFRNARSLIEFGATETHLEKSMKYYSKALPADSETAYGSVGTAQHSTSSPNPMKASHVS